MGHACFSGVAKSTARVPDERTKLTTAEAKASEIAEEQVQDFNEEGFQGYLGSFICCRKVAKVDLPVLEEHRHDVLWIAHILCMIGIVMSFLAFWGGFAHTGTLRRLPWVSLYTPMGDAYAGVKWVCWDLPYPPEKGTFGDGQSGVIGDGKGEFWQCQLWSEFDCATSPAPKACNVCKIHATGIMVSVFMAVFSFVSLFQATVKRMDGRDSNWVKFTAVLSCLIGGTNFLISATSWWYTCVLSVHAKGFTVKTGLGMYFIMIAAVFKVVMGFVHLGLPVEHCDTKVDKKLDA